MSDIIAIDLAIIRKNKINNSNNAVFCRSKVMLNFDSEIKNLKESYSSHLSNLDAISSAIKNFELQMNEGAVFIDFSYEIARASYSDYDFNARCLEWKICEKSKKWRIFLVNHESMGGEHFEDRKPLIEWDVESRILGAKYLKTFMHAFNAKAFSDFMNSTEDLEIIKSEIPF